MPPSSREKRPKTLSLAATMAVERAKAANATTVRGFFLLLLWRCPRRRQLSPTFLRIRRILSANHRPRRAHEREAHKQRSHASHHRRHASRGLTTHEREA